MNGKIQMPLIEGEIQAACKTESELSKHIATLYLKYQRNPYVDVLVKEYASTPVAVIGAVDKPGRFQLTRRVRLLELLAYAGGPTDKAGGQIVVAHTPGVSICEAPGAKNSNAGAASEGFISYALKETLRGEEQANPWIESGDMVSITEADQAYIVGNVFKPQAVPLKEQITVSQAIAMSGGTLPATKSNRVRVLRQIPGTTNRMEIMVDLGAIKQQKAEDIALKANDIVDVPTSTGKKILGSLLGAITPAASNLPYMILR
jgi:polysaccharide export outer membrane protein